MDGEKKYSPEADQMLVEVLDDLCFRFLNNLPASEYESFERLFFAVESAHWFYDDFYREKNRKLPKLQLREFSALVFRHSPVLRPYSNNVDALTAQFRSYKKDVPVCGAALLNPEMTKVLLVKGWGAGGKWGFPKGKIAKDESELSAAIREVREETGFDFTHLIHTSEEPQAIDSYTSGRLCRIFIVENIPENTTFRTNTRKEIAKIQWVPITVLPDPRSKTGSSSSSSQASSPDYHQFHEKNFSKAWLVSQYAPKLRSYIKRRKMAALASPPGTAVADSKPSIRSQKLLKEPALSCGSDPIPQRKSMSKKRRLAEELPGECQEDSALRDLKTFGLDDGQHRLTDSERNDFFRSYVEEADKRAAEMGLGDDFWPVPCITSKDFGPANADLPATVTYLHSANDSMEKEPVARTRASSNQMDSVLFIFDRGPILACLS